MRAAEEHRRGRALRSDRRHHGRLDVPGAARFDRRARLGSGRGRDRVEIEVDAARFHVRCGAPCRVDALTGRDRRDDEVRAADCLGGSRGRAHATRGDRAGWRAGGVGKQDVPGGEGEPVVPGQIRRAVPEEEVGRNFTPPGGSPARDERTGCWLSSESMGRRWSPDHSSRLAAYAISSDALGCIRRSALTNDMSGILQSRC